MQPVDLLTVLRDLEARRFGRALVVSCLLSATVLTTAHAAHADTIARPAAARDEARRDTDRQPRDSKVVDEALSGRLPLFEHEPLRELIDKYAPSAIEWSLLPHIADRSGSPQQCRRAGATRAG